ncbi:MAG: hypothetical protein K0U78_15415 [Actinomycetia bacterium]|nr:hypothetical protein [Actinomycetes bacterium]
MKKLEDFKREFSSIVEMGIYIGNPMLASIIVSQKINDIITSDYSHIEGECRSFINEQSEAKLKELMDKESRSQEKGFSKMDDILKEIFGPCDNPECEVCEPKNKESKISKKRSGTDNVFDFPSDGKIH